MQGYVAACKTQLTERQAIRIELDQLGSPSDANREVCVDTYVILRRSGWKDGAELAEAAARSTAEGERMPDDIAWIRSYVLEEQDGRVGTVCIYQASSPEAIRRHAGEAVLPVDEIIKVVDTVVVRPDPVPATA